MATQQWLMWSMTSCGIRDLAGRFRIRRETLPDDAIAGLLLGIESVPDGLAAGLLIIEGDPPDQLPSQESVVLQPYGSLFFAAAPVFEAGLPKVTATTSRNSVVILRLRGRTDLGTTFLDVLSRYAKSLAAVDSKLAIVSASDRVREQLEVAGVTSIVGEENIYIGDERVGAAVKRANREALDWIAANSRPGEAGSR